MENPYSGCRLTRVRSRLQSSIAVCRAGSKLGGWGRTTSQLWGCSGHGVCNRTTAACSCDEVFDGALLVVVVVVMAVVTVVAVSLVMVLLLLLLQGFAGLGCEVCSTKNTTPLQTPLLTLLKKKLSTHFSIPPFQERCAARCAEGSMRCSTKETMQPCPLHLHRHLSLSLSL